jgi:hypothetical protein
MVVVDVGKRGCVIGQHDLLLSLLLSYEDRRVLDVVRVVDSILPVCASTPCGKSVVVN